MEEVRAFLQGQGLAKYEKNLSGNGHHQTQFWSSCKVCRTVFRDVFRNVFCMSSTSSAAWLRLPWA
eukprot:9507052-Karenia_brevis.AAC.1